MAEKERMSTPPAEPGEETLATPGGKHEWQRLAESVPSDEENDPKSHEPRKGDMSTREGDPGDRAPR